MSPRGVFFIIKVRDSGGNMAMRPFICRFILCCFIFQICAFQAAPYAAAQYWGPSPLLSYPRASSGGTISQAFRHPTAAQDNGTNLRQFIKNGSAQDVLDYLKTHDFPKEEYSVGLLQYIPGLYITKHAQSTEKAALDRLVQLIEHNELALADLLDLIDSPSDAVAIFAVSALIPLFDNPENFTAEETKNFAIQYFIPQLQQKVTARLARAESKPASVSQTGQFLEKQLRLQYRDGNSVALQGYILLLLGKIRQTNFSLGGDTISNAQYDTLVQKAMKLFTYSRTHYEWWNGPSQERMTAANLATLALIALEGSDGFKRVVDKLEEDNTYTRFHGETPSSFDLKKHVYPRQDDLAPDNFPLLRQAFDALSVTYTKRLDSLSDYERVHMSNILVHYVNNASGATRVLAASLLADWYQRTRVFSFPADETKKESQILSETQADQLADWIKTTYYCPIQRAQRKIFNMSGKEMNEMLAQLSAAYNKIRRDPGYIYAAGTPAPCTVISGSQNVNLHGTAEDLAEEAAWFIISWGIYGKVFSWMAKGGRFLANTTRALKTAAQTGRGVSSSLREARAVAQLTRELEKNGITVTRTAFAKNGEIITSNLHTPRVPAPGEHVLGYQFSQHTPGGQILTQRFGLSKNLLAQNPWGNPATAGFSPEFHHFNSIAQGYLNRFSSMTASQLSAYRSTLAAERIFATGLGELSAQNYGTGFLMNKQWVLDEAGKKTLSYTPNWLKLTPESPIRFLDPLNRPIYGTVRMDLLPSLQRPGEVLTASLWPDAKYAMNWLGGITLAETTFDVLDFSSDFPVQFHQNNRERRTELLEEGQIRTPKLTGSEIWWRNISQNPFQNPSYSGSVLQLPYLAVAMPWQAAKSFFFPPADFNTRLLNNPYMKLYRQQYEWNIYPLEEELELTEDIPLEENGPVTALPDEAPEEIDYEEEFDPYF